MDANGIWYGLMSNGKQGKDMAPGKVLVIGAGSRGKTYSRIITESTNAVIAAVAEPIEYKRKELGRRYIWRDCEPKPWQQFAGWKQFLEYELNRRARANAGQQTEKGVDAVLVCTLDEQHAEIVTGLAPLKIHLFCEKPLATTLEDCLSMYSALLPDGPGCTPEVIFSIGHVLRYSPHNTLLRKLLLQDRLIGDIVSVEHTEPVGWWHFAHSYVRGNWRRESSSAPSLLTKSCHDIDFLLWLLCSPFSSTSNEAAHVPSKIGSFGRLNYFRKSRKPAAAGAATNCLSCPIEPDCKYSAKRIYYDHRLRYGWASWPVSIVSPDIEECVRVQGPTKAKEKLLSALAEDYTAANGSPERPYFGRCVYEADNDVCDDQWVTIEWEDDITDASSSKSQDTINRHAKSATFHMIAHSQAVCERRGRVYGTQGEISYDSTTIKHTDFATGKESVYTPGKTDSSHGGGDKGIAVQFIRAVDAVRQGTSVAKAQAEHIGCTLPDILRSHAVVFAAEDARRESKVISWKDWWHAHVEVPLAGSPLGGDFEMVNP